MSRFLTTPCHSPLGATKADHVTRRVAVVTTSYPAFADDPSGHFVATEARELAARGADVTVIAPGSSVADASIRLSTGSEGRLRVVRTGGGELFGWPGVMSRAHERPSRLLRLPPWLFRARQAIHESGADELVAHWVLPSIVPLAVGMGLSPEAVTGVSHGSDIQLLVRSPMAVRTCLVRSILRRVGCWRFVSTTLHDRLAATLDRATARALARIARVEPSPLDLPDVDARARELRTTIAEDSLYLVASRLVPAKRVAACLDWAASTASRSPGARATRVVVLGEGPEEAPLQEQARRLESPRLRIDMLGTKPRSETLAWIAAADALLHASREEGLSTVVREAAHYGTQVFTLP